MNHVPKPSPRLESLRQQQHDIRQRLQGLPNGPLRWMLEDRLFELRCSIRAEKERQQGIMWQCDSCGMEVPPDTWLEFCPCGGHWRPVRPPK